MPPWLLAGLGQAIPSLIGAIFGRKNEPVVTRTRETYSFNRLRKAAEKAGFNPLTALRATGGGVGSTSSTIDPALSQRNLFVDAIGQGISGALSYDPVAAESARLNVELQQQALQAGKAQLAAPSWSGVSDRSNDFTRDDALAGISHWEGGRPVYYPDVLTLDQHGVRTSFPSQLFQPDLLLGAAANRAANLGEKPKAWYNVPLGPVFSDWFKRLDDAGSRYAGPRGQRQ